MSNYPKVRGACEYCHRRKIRCILPPDSNACHNCAAIRTTCLFAPRAKAGRPRRSTAEASTTSTQLSPSSDPEPTPPDSSEGTTDDSLEATASSSNPATVHSTLADDRWTQNEDIAHLNSLHLQPQFLFPFNRQQWPDFTTNSSDEGLPGSSHGASGTHDFLQDPLPTPSILSSGNNNNNNNNNINPFHNSRSGSTSAGTMTPLTPALSHSTTLTTTTGDFDWTPDSSNPSSSSSSNTQHDFDSALKLCAGLDHRCRSVRKSNCLRDAESHLQALDSVCMASIKWQPSSDSASRALIIAALHKALEICDVLVRASRSSARTSDSAMLQQLLLLRRLDIVVTFAKIYFMRTGQASGTKTAEELHGAIERLLRVEYGQWGWGQG